MALVFSMWMLLLIGSPVASTDPVPGTPCTSDTECGENTFMECVFNTCTCAVHYYEEIPGSCFEIPAERVGRNCSTDTETTECGTGLDLICVDSNCSCDMGTGVKGGICFEEGTLNGFCSSSSPCFDPNAICRNSVCICKEKCFAKGKECVVGVELGGNCLAATDNTRGNCQDDNAVCPDTDKRCTCSTNYFNKNGACEKRAELGGACFTNITGYTDTRATCLDVNANCSISGECTCRTNYTQKGAACEKNEDRAGAMALGASLAMTLAAICMVFKLQ